VYDPKKGAAHYLTKYVVKDNYQSGWYDIKGLEYLNQLVFDIKNRKCIIVKPLIIKEV
jgi:hypothetical protein